MTLFLIEGFFLRRVRVVAGSRNHEDIDVMNNTLEA
jgi:hypothetical protein